MPASRKCLLFLFPAATPDRLWEDGLTGLLEQRQIEYAICRYRISSRADAEALCADWLAEPAVHCVVYPRLDSPVFHWAGAERDWFFPGRDERRNPLRAIPDGSRDLVDINGLLAMLSERGVQLLPADYRYGGPFEDDFEMTFYWRAENFLADILAQAPELTPE